MASTLKAILRFEADVVDQPSIIALLRDTLKSVDVSSIDIEETGGPKNTAPVTTSDENIEVDLAILALFDTGAPLTRPQIIYNLCDPAGRALKKFPERRVSLRIQRLVNKKYLILLKRGSYAINPKLSYPIDPHGTEE